MQAVVASTSRRLFHIRSGRRRHLSVRRARRRGPGQALCASAIGGPRYRRYTVQRRTLLLNAGVPPRRHHRTWKSAPPGRSSSRRCGLWRQRNDTTSSLCNPATRIIAGVISPIGRIGGRHRQYNRPARHGLREIGRRCRPGRRRRASLTSDGTQVVDRGGVSDSFTIAHGYWRLRRTSAWISVADRETAGQPDRAANSARQLALASEIGYRSRSARHSQST